MKIFIIHLHTHIPTAAPQQCLADNWLRFNQEQDKDETIPPSKPQTLT